MNCPRLFLTLAALWVLFGCAGAPLSEVPRLRGAPEADRVVVLVPGVTGSELRNPRSGEVSWGTGHRLLHPHDRGYAFALPIPPATEPEPLEAPEILKSLQILRVFGKGVYGPILDLFAEHGFTEGNLRKIHDIPPRGDVILTFPYDWRRDNVEAAGQLAEALRELARRRAPRADGEAVRVVLLCQSNGAHICRWLMKYGDATLEEAEAMESGGGGSKERPGQALSGLEITDLVLVGTSNGGSLRILRELNRGRTYVPLIGRRMAPEVLFTFPSLYQDLPACWEDLFVDGEAEPLPLDLYDAETWRRHGWAIYREPTARRIARGEAPPQFGTGEERRAFLAAALDRARRFHRLLRADLDPDLWRGAPAPPRLHLIQSRSDDTPRRAVVERRKDGSFRTSFTGDRRVDRRPRRSALATSPGDGHATEESQLCLSPTEAQAIIGDPLFVEGGHFEMILTDRALTRMLEIGLGE